MSNRETECCNVLKRKRDLSLAVRRNADIYCYSCMRELINVAQTPLLMFSSITFLILLFKKRFFSLTSLVVMSGYSSYVL